MSKRLVIPKVSFKKYDVDGIDDINFKMHVASVEEIDNPEFTCVYTDADGRIVYGVDFAGRARKYQGNPPVVDRVVEYCEGNGRPQTSMIAANNG